jgi:Carboxypeptidase regulatory-like domain/Prenyltransferase and squalene oxidase repeat
MIVVAKSASRADTPHAAGIQSQTDLPVCALNLSSTECGSQRQRPAQLPATRISQQDKNMGILRKSLALGVALLGLLAPVAQAQVSPEVTRSLVWLQSQVAADGGVSGEATSIATTVQVRSETALCLATLAEPMAVSAGLRSKLAAGVDEPTEHLARKAIALSAVAVDVGTLASQIATRQNVDGGFGPAAGFASTVLDTVWSYSALSRGSQFSGASGAKAFILSNLQSDGGLAGSTLAQRVQNSALGILALQFAGNDLPAINATRQIVQWLLATQQADGSWGSSSHLSAVALYAVSSQGADSIARASARAYLLARQTANGSWSDDPYLTAVVLRAIAVDPKATPQVSSITGLATDPLTGTPIAGVQVALSGAANAVATSAGDGRFSFANLNSGAYTLALAKTGYAATTRSASLGYGQILDLGSIGMGQVSTTGIVKGRVMAATSGLAIGAASVVVSGAVGATLVTDAQGNYELANVPAGTVSIAVSKTGYAAATATGSVSSGQTLVFSPTLYDLGASGVPTTGRLIGKVVSAGTGAAIAGVSIELNGVVAALTGSDGRFDVTSAPRSYVMRIALSGYDLVAGNFLLTAGALVDAGTIALSPQRTNSAISGRVVDQATGQAIRGASVAIVGGSTTTSGSDGSYAFLNLTGTTFDVRVSAAGYLTQVWQLQVERPSVISQDFAIASQPTSTIDLLDLTVTPPSAAPHTAIRVAGSIVNGGTASQDVVLILQVLDPDGKVVATGSAFTADGSNLLGSFALAAAERRPILFKWETGQFAPGLYRLVGTVVEAGTVSRDNPNGRVLATRSTTIGITASGQFIGSVTADPSVLRANTGTTVKLSALIQNNGNVDLRAQSYRLQVIDDKTSAVVTSLDVAGIAVTPNQIQRLAFANWTPTTGGNFRLEVTVPGATEQGKLIGKLYVGDAATASYTVDKAVVPAGNQTVRATLLVTGQDSASGTISDPLAEPIKVAIQKSVTYNDLQASNWVVSNKCLGCHVVSQALTGGELTRRLTTYDNTQRNGIFNALSTYRQANGAVYASHPEFAGAQSMLGLWALNSWRKKDELAASLAAVADFVLGRQEGTGSWTTDYPNGWWDARPANTAFNLKSLTEVVDTLKRVPSPVAYSSQVWASGGGISGAYYLEKTSTGQTLVSNYTGGSVTAINPDGSTQTFANGLASPQGLVQGADGNLYIATGSGIRKRAPDGTTTEFSPVLVDGLVMGPDGYLYGSRYSLSTIYRVSPSGVSTTYMSGSPLNGPVGLSFDVSGNLIVVNYAGLSIVRIKPDKSYEMVVTWTNGNPRSVVPFKEGWLVGTTTGAYRYNADWQGERVAFSATEGLVVLADGTIVTGGGGSTVEKLLPVAIDGAAKIASYSSAIGRATTWLLNDANVNTSSNLELAHRLIGLGSAKAFYTGNPLADTLQTKMQSVGALLRSRQRSDGGWGRSDGQNSDSMVTAQVGYALDYLQPTASDPVVQNAIKFLLARQQADGSWLSENGVLTTHLAATTWVEIWLPIALDRIGGIDADLTLRFAPNVSLSNPSIAPTTTTSNADGSVTRKWQLVGVTSASRSIQFDLGLADMQLGETRPASAEAFMTFRNSFTSESVDSPIPVPAVAASAFLGLGVSTDKTEYGAGADVVIAGRVSNLGVVAAGGSVEYAIYALDGTPVASLARVPFANLAVGASSTVPATWNTGATYAGQYYVEAKLYNSANVYVGKARSAFAIRAAGTAGALTLTGLLRLDKLSYAPSEVVRLLDRITNLAVNQNASGLQLITSVANPDGSIRWTASASLAEVAAGALKDVSYAMPLNTAPTGSYVARLVVKDGSGSVVATDSKTFTVQSSAITGAGLIGTLQTTPKQVPLGDTAVITFDVTNRGNDTLANLPLTMNLVDPVTQQVIATFPYIRSVAPSATYAGSANWTAVGVVGKTYVAVLTADIGGRTIVLAQDNLSVIEPPVRLALGPGVRHEARLLVLVSCSPGADARGQTAPEDPVCATARAQWLSSFLTAQGIQHHISTTVEDFVGELHCGRYNTYWLSGGTNKLGATVVKEVREAVRRGAGLLIDGTHDERNGLIDEVPGVFYRGKLPSGGYAVQLNAPVFSARTLTSVGTALKYDLAGGTAQANFPAEPTLPAIVTRTFGEGHAALFAFDLVGGLQAGTWTEVFRSGLTAVAPAQPGTYVGGAWVPLVLSVSNQVTQGAAVIVSAQLPSGVVLEGAPVGSTLDTTGNPVWQFSLAAGETREILLAVRAPYLSGPVSVPFQVSTVRNGVTRVYGSISAGFTVQAADAMGSGLVAAIRALAPTTAPQRNARDRAVTNVQAGLTLMTQAKYADAMAQLLNAADELESITTASVFATSADVARLIAEAEAHQCNSLPLCTTAVPRVVNDGYFSPFATSEGLEARGGAWGTADWEWGLGADTTTSGAFALAQHTWVSGKQYGWTLGYDNAGNGRLSVLDGTSTVLSLGFTGTSTARLRTGNTLQIGVRATSAAGLAKVDATVTKLQGQAVFGAQATRGDGTYSEGQLTYLLPGAAGALTASGTVRLSFPDLTPPASSALTFTVKAGNSMCRAN